MRFGMVILQRGFLGRWKDLLGKDGLAGQKAGWKGFCPRRRSGFRAVAGGAGGIGLFPGFGRRALFGLAALGAMLGLIMPGRGNCVGLNQARGGPAEKDAACGEKERPELSLPGDSSTARPRCSEPEGPTGHFADSSWPMEQIELTGGEIRWGLIDSVDEQWVHWVEIRRPAGRPGYVVVRPVERSLVVRMVRLPETERQRLQSRVASMAFHARIETAQMEAIALQKQVRDGMPLFVYRGRSFRLETTLPEEMTRRLIVRLEQVFSAYRQLLPPRTAPRQTLRMEIFSSRIDYEEALRRYEVLLGNPAVFLPKENLVLAGTDLGHFAVQLDQLRQEHHRLRQELSQLRSELSKKLEELGRKLREQGVPRQEAAKILHRERAALDSQITQKLNEIQRVERNNGELFSKIMERTLRQLYHEAFHAYMENYLFPTAEYQTPMWLQEGLAMLFQEGVLEADTLRIDAPYPKAVEVIRSDQRQGTGMPLAQILSAGPSEFLQTPEQTLASANRYYAYAWAVVYYLCQAGRLAPERLESYLSPATAALSPMERFVRLVGMSKEECEQDWQKFLRRW